ncbi:MAG: hypothetical protein AB8G96_01725 [Phycisphaerales bacterium]
MTGAPRPADRRSCIAVVTLVTDPALYATSIGSVARAARRVGVDLELQPVCCADHGWNAAQGLNHGIDQTKARWVLCIHQDVVLPSPWFCWAQEQIARAGGSDAWPVTETNATASPAVIGTVGTTASGRFAGAVLDPNGYCRWGRGPTDVASLDEHLLLLDRESGLRFDADVPGFHAYGTDLVLQARAAGHRAVAIDAPVVHASSGTIDAAWNAAAAWIVDRWTDHRGEVVPTPARTMHHSGTTAFTARPAMHRATVALHRRLAVHTRRLRQVAGGRWAMPATVREELVDCIRGLPSDVQERMGRANVG